MDLLSLWKSRRTMVSGAVVSVAALTLTAFALLDDGVPTTDVELHDGGVWLTNESLLLAGHLNNQSRVLDGSYRTTSGAFDVAQEGNTIVVHDLASSTVATVDPASLAAPAVVPMPADAQFGLGAAVAAVLDPADGRLWVMPVDALGSADLGTMPPLAQVGERAALVVGRDGTVVAASGATGDVVTATLSGSVARIVSESTLDLPDDAELMLTAVGSIPVFLETTTHVLWVQGHQIAVPDDTVLQQPSASGEAVVLATPDAWWSQPLDGSEATVSDLGGTGDPAAPVVLNGCTYAAWAGAGEYRRDCVNDAYDVAAPIDGALPSARFVFRVNRNVVVLNDIVSGTGWLSTEGMERVENWDDLLPPPDETQDNVEYEEEDDLTSLPERSEDNTPPVAEDDHLGARAGRTTILPVIDNDYDLDGDLLTAVVVDASGVPGSVQPIRDGEAFQVVLPDEASGTAQFTYRVSDGRGGFDDATVTLTIAGAGVNTAPAPQRQSRLTIEAGASVDYNVLPDWIDPEGDILFLKAASAPSPHSVEFSPDGTVTVTAAPDSSGTFEVDVIVSDGIDDAVGTLRVDVRAAETLPPQTNSDHVTTTVGRPVTVTPVANDMSRSGEPLRLAKIEEVLGVSLVPDYSRDAFTFASNIAGTYYVQYLVSDGENSAAGLVRIDVLPELEGTQPPIAVADTALVAPGQATLVDVLANDSDPGGKVLVIQNVEVPERTGLEVSILEHRLVRITDVGGLVEPVTLSYLVSNGTDSARASITVLPIALPDTFLPPVAQDDEVVVRAGDVATVHVLDNDESPSGDELTLVGLAEPLVDPSVAQVFVSGDTIRVVAGMTEGAATATYSVSDSRDQAASAQVTIRIIGAEAENSPPRPEDAVARVLAGNTVRIPINLDGIDPDGDSTVLEGLATAPQLGRVVQVGEEWLVYEAYADAQGTDTFEYEVSDRLGASARGTVVVGVAPVRGFNNAPIATRDDAKGRTGASVSVAVLDNDSDPDADLISLSTELEVPAGVTAEVRGDRVVLSSDAEGQYTIQYSISDVYGATATGAILFTVSDDLVPEAPIARDDRAAAADVAEDGTIAVTVLANDEDPDGMVSDLRVEVDDAAAIVGPDGVVTVTVSEVSRAIPYTVTDVDGLSATALILVPAQGEVRPQLVSAAPIVVDSGETRTIKLSDYIVTGNGNPPIITTAESVRAAHANGDTLVVDEGTLVYTSATGYSGKDGITLEVTDGVTVDDPAGRVASLTIPLTVMPTGNVAPVFRDARIEVTPGEEPASLDLALLASDQNEDDVLTFQIVGEVPSGFSASIEGTTLLAAAASDTAKGTLTDLEVAVSDGIADPVVGLVRIAVTTSSRSLAVPNDDYVDDARPGQTQTIDVLANDVNPFPESPLQIVSHVVESGTAEVEENGGQLLVTPGNDFHGVIQVRYTVRDNTDDPDREVEARVYVTVVAAPEAPPKPAVRSVEDRTVVLEWTAPPNNGAPITEYTVRSDQGTVHACSTTICTIDGLSNDVTYRFTVTATNRAGESEPSIASDEARPDVRPEQPEAPTLTFGDASLSVVWTAPVSEGSAITHYSLEISPSPIVGPSEVASVTGTSYEWTGLENGVAYQVRVRAHNAAPEPSAWSSYSATEVPAGVPDAPAAPTTNRLEPVGSRAQIQAVWAEPSGNGDSVSSYTVSALRGGTVVTSVEVPAGVYSQAFELATDDTSYTFTVVAHNKAGASPASAQSEARRAFVAPGAPTAVTATPGDRNVTVAFTPGARNGADASWITYEYQLNGTGSWRALPGNRVITSLTNGTAYTVTLRATATSDGVAYTGASSAASAAATPFGTPPTPTVSSTNNNGTVRFTWQAATTNGRPITLLQYRINGGSWTNGSVSGGSVNAPSAGGTHKIEVKVQDSEGQWSSIATTTRTISPELRVWKSGTKNTTDCSAAADCYFLDYELKYGPPNTVIYFECLNSLGVFSSSSVRLRTDGSGYAVGNDPNNFWCYIGKEANNSWSGPYWMRLTINGQTIESNKNVSW